MAFLAVSPETLSCRGLYVPDLYACMKAPMSCIFSDDLVLSSMGLLMLCCLLKSIQQRQLRAYLEWVWMVTPSSWADSAPAIQSMRLLLVRVGLFLAVWGGRVV